MAISSVIVIAALIGAGVAHATLVPMGNAPVAIEQDLRFAQMHQQIDKIRGMENNALVAANDAGLSEASQEQLTEEADLLIALIDECDVIMNLANPTDSASVDAAAKAISERLSRAMEIDQKINSKMAELGLGPNSLE